MSTGALGALDDPPVVQTNTVGPLIIESPWAKKIVSTGALETLDDPLVVQMKI